MTFYLRQGEPTNRFFLAHGDVPFDPPSRGYFRLDQTEPVNLEEAEVAVFSFEGVDADWLQSAKTPPQGYWRRLFDKSGWASEDGEPPHDMPFDVFGEMPLYRLEVSCKREEPVFSALKEMALDQDPWLFFERGTADRVPCDIFGNLFGGPLPTDMGFRLVGQEEQELLNAWFDIAGWPDATDQELERSLSINTDIEFLIVYDIGQGSANALTDRNRMPQLYFDLGCGVYRNARTAPFPAPEFCWTHDPAIVLSHWDADHWGAAHKDRAAVGQTWIAPRDHTLGATHVAFANEILQKGGKLLIWGPSPAEVRVHMRGGADLVVGRCNGRDRNGTGLAMVVEDSSLRESRGWLLTGDAGYDEIPLPLPDVLSAIVVPHHGADMGPRSANIPTRPPSSKSSARLVYSFGAGNRHGRYGTSHPKAATVSAHCHANWAHGTWKGLPDPGTQPPGGDAIATAVHQTTHAGGVIAGWLTAPPNLLTAHCGGQACNVEVKQV